MSTGDKPDALENLLARLRKTAAERAEQAKGSEPAPAAAGETDEDGEMGPETPRQTTCAEGLEIKNSLPASARANKAGTPRGDESFEEIRLEDQDVQFEDVRRAAIATPTADEGDTSDRPPTRGGIPGKPSERTDLRDSDAWTIENAADTTGEYAVATTSARPLISDDPTEDISPNDFEHMDQAAEGSLGLLSPAEKPDTRGEHGDDAETAPQEASRAVDAPPASARQPRDELRSAEEGERLVDADAFVELVDEEPPPASGEVESQRLASAYASSEATGDGSRAVFEVRLAPEEPPASASAPEAVGPVQPVVIDVGADVTAFRPLAHDPAVFLGAVRRQPPATFGALLDAALTLGS